MRKKYSKNKRALIFLTILLFLEFNFACNNTQGTKIEETKYTINYTLDSIWNGTGATRVVTSGKYLYIIKDGNTVVMLENEESMGSFECNGTIFGVTAIDTTLILNYANQTLGGLEFPDGLYIWALSFENATNPVMVSNTSIYDDIGTMFLNSYKQYVYVPFFEFGFFILDYTNISDPLIRGSFIVSWHANAVEIVDDYGLFIGDTGTGIYYLAEDPIKPYKLWKKVDYSSGWGLLLSTGTFGVSDKYFAYFTKDYPRNFALVIPRINQTHVGQPFNVSVDREYITSGIIYENILVALKSKNSINLWEINEELENIVNISLIQFSELKAIKLLHWIERTNDFYVVDGEKGLYKLSIAVEIKKNLVETPYGFFPLGTIIIMSVFIVRKRLRKK